MAWLKNCPAVIAFCPSTYVCDTPLNLVAMLLPGILEIPFPFPNDTSKLLP
jgi:hypothetical protein